jgi:PAS domain S-box-containing protein
VKPGWPLEGWAIGAKRRDLAQVLEQSGDAVIVKDLNAIVTYWNREAASLYGYSAEEAIGQPLRTLHAAELSEADYASLLARVRAGRPSAPHVRQEKDLCHGSFVGHDTRPFRGQTATRMAIRIHRPHRTPN